MATPINYHWLGGVGAYDDPARWSPFGVPGLDDNVTFNAGGTVDGGPGGVWETAFMSVRSTVAFTSIGGSYAVVANVTNGLSVAGGSLTIEAGSAVDTSLTGIIVGDASVSASIDGGGTIIVSVGSLSASAGGLAVGLAGRGTLIVENHGIVRADDGNVEHGSLGAGDEAGSSGTVDLLTGGTLETTEGAVIIGLAGNGLLHMASGARAILSSGSNLYASLLLANVVGSTGTLSMQGASSIASTDGGDSIGYAGSGTATIAGGSTFIATQGAASYDAIDVGELAGSRGSVTITGAGSIMTANVGGFGIGDSGQGSVTVTAGGGVEVNASDAGIELGLFAGGSGSLALNGTGSHLLDTGWLDVGYGGTGRFSMTAGTTVAIGASLDVAVNAAIQVGAIKGAVGTISVTGANSVMGITGQIDIGTSGRGSFSVTDGATVASGDATGKTFSGIVEGYFAGGTGTLLVSGADSNLSNTGQFDVGASGSGSLTVAAGALVKTSGSAGMELGVYAGGSGTVTVGDATLAVAGFLAVGGSGTGSLRITAKASISVGATVDATTSASLLLGDFAKSSGTVTVGGVGAHLTVAGQADIGTQGAGTLVIDAGGTVVTGDRTGASGAGIALGYFSGGTGTATLTGAGASLTNTGQFVVGSAGGGTLAISGGAVVKTSVTRTGFDGADIGLFAGGSGIAIVTGPGSQWTVASNLVVGFEGGGTLTASQDGRIAVATTFLVGELSGGHATVTVQTGARLSAAQEITIGDQTGSSGAITVQERDAGGHSARLSYGGPLVIGDQGHGGLDVLGGGIVGPVTGSGGGEIDIGIGHGGYGHATIAGTLDGTSLAMGQSASAAAGEGLLTLSGTTDVSGEALVGTGGTIALTGGVLGAAKVAFLGSGIASGHGSIKAAVTGGAITATGGQLAITGDVSGTGATYAIDAASTLLFGDAVASGVDARFASADAASLVLDKATLMQGLIQSFLKGDTVKIVGETELSASYTGNTTAGILHLGFSHGAKAALHFAGDETRASFAITNSGGNVLIAHT